MRNKEQQMLIDIVNLIEWSAHLSGIDLDKQGTYLNSQAFQDKLLKILKNKKGAK